MTGAAFFRLGAIVAATLATVAGAVATFGGCRPPAHPLSSGEQRRVVQAFAPVTDAVRSYAAQHGKPPATLAALAPTYLPALPTCPPGLCVGHNILYTAENRQWRLAVPVRGAANAVITYSSTGDYPGGKPNAPVTRIGAWAYFGGDPY